jgi:plasmid stability protein
MTTITIHNLPESLERKLREQAKIKKQSINQTVKDLIEVGLSPSYSALRREQKRELFKEFFGTWTNEEAEAFDKAIECFNEINEEDWA